MVDERGFEPRPPHCEQWENKLRQGAQSLSYFHEALNWQTWQTGFLLVFSMQFDGEKPDIKSRAVPVTTTKSFSRTL